MPARTAILLALIRGKSYGLELIERVAEKTNRRIRLGQGSVYPLLHDLEDEGLLRSWEAEPLPERGGRPRRYYELTGKGLRVANEQHEVLLGIADLATAFT